MSLRKSEDKSSRPSLKLADTLLFKDIRQLKDSTNKLNIITSASIITYCNALDNYLSNR